MDSPRGRYSRGYLPHLDVGSKPQFITWRQADSVPREVIDAWRQELAREPDPVRRREMHRRIEHYLDQGHGSCILRNPSAAIIVQNNLLYHHGGLYELHDWAVMPNHVHVLLTPAKGISLERITHACKSYTSHKIGEIFPTGGDLWQAESVDRFIRDEGHFERTALYIRWNPVKAKLVADPSLWPYSSASRLNQERLAAIQRERKSAAEPAAIQSAGEAACVPSVPPSQSPPSLT